MIGHLRSARRTLSSAQIVSIGSLFFCFLLTFSDKELAAQKFHFGGSIAATACQVDGDDLVGFNKLGFQGGLLGGYSFDSHNWLVVELQYSSIGSKKKNEDVDLNLEMDMQTINVFLGYSRRFGDTWEGRQKFRLFAGPKVQRIIEVESPNIPENSFKSMFVSAEIGCSYIFTPSFMADLTYTHSLMNILDEPAGSSTDKLVPYYLSLGVSYYLNKKKAD